MNRLGVFSSLRSRQCCCAPSGMPIGGSAAMAPKRKSVGGEGGSKAKKAKENTPTPAPKQLATPHVKLFQEWV